MNHKPFVIAHRGFSGKYPENTVLSASEASKVGADIIEFDLQLTKDKEVVVFHDATVERILLRETPKKIGEYTLKELKQKDFGLWFNKKFSGCNVATLEDFLKFKEESALKFDYIIEIKDRNYEELIPRVKDLLSEFHFSFSNGYLSVRDENVFKIAIDNSFSKRDIGLMQKRRTPLEAIELALDLKVKCLQLRPRIWTKEDWEKLRNTTLSFTIFYGDTEDEFKWMIEKKPYGIFTNFPNKLTKFLIDNQS